MKTEKHAAICAAALCFLIALFIPGRAALASDGVETAGDVLRWLVPAAAYTTTFVLHDAEGRKQFHKSFLVNVAASYGLKAVISKTRPNGEDDDSFPSAHTSMAFQGSAFIHRRYGFRYAVPAYLASVFVGWSRVDSDNHYTLDVVAGAAIGIASSLIFTKPYKGFTVTPLAYGGFYGVSIARQWR
jgi:membrane-associated phospholipid phosphatase